MDSKSVVWSMEWFAKTDRGRVRPNNEDAYLLMACSPGEVRVLEAVGHEPILKEDFLFAVSDGMGGARSGELASSLAMEELSVAIPKAMIVAASQMDPDRLGLLEEVLRRIHQRIREVSASDEECEGMGATLSLCWFIPGWMFFAHVGDSRIYYYRDGEMVQLTHDDTYVGEKVRAGKLNERQARSHPQKNVLYQVMGGRSDKVEPQVGAVRYDKGDCFLICSDGLTDGLWQNEIQDGFEDWVKAERTAEWAGENYLKNSLRASGRDNVTLILIRANQEMMP